MTSVTFHVEGSRITGFDAVGHSGYAEAGADIVCAAVSSAAYMTANTLTEVMGCRAFAADGEGRMAVFPAQADLARCQELLQGFRLHMEGLQEQYPRNISVETVEGDCPAEYVKGRV